MDQEKPATSRKKRGEETKSKKTAAKEKLPVASLTTSLEESAATLREKYLLVPSPKPPLSRSPDPTVQWIGDPCVFEVHPSKFFTNTPSLSPVQLHQLPPSQTPTNKIDLETSTSPLVKNTPPRISIPSDQIINLASPILPMPQLQQSNIIQATQNQTQATQSSVPPPNSQQDNSTNKQSMTQTTATENINDQSNNTLERCDVESCIQDIKYILSGCGSKPKHNQIQLITMNKHLDAMAAEHKRNIIEKAHITAQYDQLMKDTSDFYDITKLNNRIAESVAEINSLRAHIHVQNESHREVRSLIQEIVKNNQITTKHIENTIAISTQSSREAQEQSVANYQRSLAEQQKSFNKFLWEQNREYQKVINKCIEDCDLRVMATKRAYDISLREAGQKLAMDPKIIEELQNANNNLEYLPLATSTSPSKQSYADQLSKGEVKDKPCKKHSTKPAHIPTTYLIKPNTTQKEGYCRDLFTKSEAIKDSNIKITKLTNSRSGAMLVEVPSAGEGEKLEEIVKKATDFKTLDINVIRKRSPQIILLNIDDDITMEDLGEQLKKKNELLTDSNFKLQFKIKARRKTNHWIINTTPELFRALREEYIYLGTGTIKFEEFLSIKQCSSCGHFGHSAKACPGPRVCIDCGKPPHEDECIRKCINCTFSNKNFGQTYKTNHHAFDKTCENYLRKVSEYKKKVQY